MVSSSGAVLRLLAPAYMEVGFASNTMNSLCTYTRCKDNLDVATMPLVTNHCILTAVVTLNNGQLDVRTSFLVTKAVA